MPSISLRKFPYPYRAALALSNDADFMTEESFRLLHRYLNTTRDSALGRGLGLPVADSFFLFSSPDSRNAFTLFEGLSDRFSSRAPFMLECARAGVIDTLHTFGDFTAADHFDRDLARRGLDALARENVGVRVWVNHGAATNVQCLGPLNNHFRGDLPGDRAHHADLSIAYGIRFYWLGDTLGDYISYDGRWDPRALLAWAKGVIRSRRLGSLRSLMRPGSELLYPIRLRDGATILGFNRYAGTAGLTPVLENLPAQLSPRNLALLKKTGGYAIVYQHFAVRRRSPGFGVDNYVPNEHPYLRPEETAALDRLAREFHDGNIFVTSSARLLRYNEVQRGLRWTASSHEQGHRIALLGISDATGASRSPEPADAEGLTFYTPDPRHTEIWRSTAQGEVLLRGLVVNRADQTGCESISLPPSFPGMPDF
jgi:hypothetical protein